MSDLLEALWLFLPAGIANTAPVFANKIPGLNLWQTPLDFGRAYRGKRIFGPNKTWRGVAFAVLLAAVTGALQARFDFHPYNTSASVWIGILLGFGAIYGDAAESFFKRQYGVESGRSWFPFDQTDYILGALLAVAPLALFSLPQMAVVLVVYFGLHLAVAYCAFLLKLKDRPI